MDVIARNFFRLMRTGALHDDEVVEPMSYFKWRRLSQMAQAQHVENVARAGILGQPEGTWLNLPEGFMDGGGEEGKKDEGSTVLCNRYLDKRFRRIEHNELHAIDTNVEALDVLRIIVYTVSMMLNRGMMLKGILRLGSYLRTKGDKVDFLKLDSWLGKLHLRRMAQLQGSMLIAVFNFDKDELPFVQRVEPSAYNLVVRSVLHTASDTAEEWHFRQSRSGFVTNNSGLLRRNLRRSLRYLAYAPMETVSNYFSNFALSLQEIEE